MGGRALATRRYSSRVAVLLLVVVAAGMTAPRWALAAGWGLGVAGSTGAQAQSLPIKVPSTVTSSCPAPQTSKTVRVTWASAAHATFFVYQSTTSATSGFSLVATGLSGTAWTSGTLGNGSYWYQVAAAYGAIGWTSARSTATGPRVISSNAPVCE